jgi:hypothetical protein
MLNLITDVIVIVPEVTIAVFVLGFFLQWK